MPFRNQLITSAGKLVAKALVSPGFSLIRNFLGQAGHTVINGWSIDAQGNVYMNNLIVKSIQLPDLDGVTPSNYNGLIGNMNINGARDVYTTNLGIAPNPGWKVSLASLFNVYAEHFGRYNPSAGGAPVLDYTSTAYAVSFSTNADVATATQTPVVFDTVIDPSNCMRPIGGPYTSWVCPEYGHYLITASITYPPTSTAGTQYEVRLGRQPNGGSSYTLLNRVINAPSASINTTVTATWAVSLATFDSIQLFAYQTSGAAKTLVANFTPITYLNIARY